MGDYLTKRQRDIVRERADRAGVSMMAIVRRGVEMWIQGGNSTLQVYAKEIGVDLGTLGPARSNLLHFGDLIREKRRERNVSMRGLSADTGIRLDVIQRIEAGSWMPDDATERTLRDWLTSS